MSEREDALKQRQSGATSDETVDDVEKSDDSGSPDSKRDPGPSPDGRLDEPDELKDAAPM
ncbi:MAG TPA: hypothetical protein VIT88_03115 [Pyrinomonadaceae bacterium]